MVRDMHLLRSADLVLPGAQCPLLCRRTLSNTIAHKTAVCIAAISPNPTYMGYEDHSPYVEPEYSVARIQSRIQQSVSKAPCITWSTSSTCVLQVFPPHPPCMGRDGERRSGAHSSCVLVLLCCSSHIIRSCCCLVVVVVMVAVEVWLSCCCWLVVAVLVVVQ